MTDTPIKLSIADGLARLVLDRPDRGNPIDTAFVRQLREIAVDLSQRDDVRCVLITANGKVFSAGGDIKTFAQDRAKLPHLVKLWTADIHVAISTFMRMPAPVVIAVTGNVGGGGLGLVASADFVVAGDNTKFASGFAALGFSSDSSTTVSLTQRMGWQRAKRFLMLAEVMDAKEAAAVGLVDFIVQPETVLQEAEALAVRLAAGPTRALGGLKTLMIRTKTNSPEAQMEEEAQMLAAVVRSEDAWEGVQAFAGKRKAAFKGK